MNTALHPYMVLIAFLLPATWGYFLLPELSLSLYPQAQERGLGIEFSWPDKSAEIIEQEVTANMEASLSRIQGIRGITSLTSHSQGQIQIFFDSRVDQEAMQMEIRAQIRSLLPHLPEGIGYPRITSLGKGEQRPSPAMILTVSAEVDRDELYFQSRDLLLPLIRQVDGVEEAYLSGHHPREWEAIFDPDQLSLQGMSPQEWSISLQNTLFRRFLSDTWLLDGRKATKDLAFPPLQRSRYDEEKIFRINGQEALALVIYAEEGSNQLHLSRKLSQVLYRENTAAKDQLEVKVAYDSSRFVHKELKKIGGRSTWVLLLLLGFTWLISRSPAYLFITVFSLAINLGIASLFYYLLKLDLHLNSLAALALSLGLIIDSCLIAIEDIRQKGRLEAFPALLAAGLSTILPLSLVFFLKEDLRLQLIDFAKVMGVNILISLVVGGLLIPSLMKWTKIKPRRSPHFFSSLGRLNSFFKKNYLAYLRRFSRHAWLGGLLLLWAFGLPFFMIPKKVELQKADEDILWKSALENVYEKSLGSKYFQEEIKPFLQKYLGGSLGLFAKDVISAAEFRTFKPLILEVRIQMPPGTKRGGINEIFLDLEHFLLQFDEIREFQSEITNSQDALLRIFFTKEAEKSDFPYALLAAIRRQALRVGGADWMIAGVGLGFSNAVNSDRKNTSICLKGYNYSRLMGLAEELKAEIEDLPRVEKAYINGKIRSDYRPHPAYLLLPDWEKMAIWEVEPEELYKGLATYTYSRVYLGNRTGRGGQEDIFLSNLSSSRRDLWQCLNYPIRTEKGKFLKLGECVEVREIEGGRVISRKNQEYSLFVEFDFLGPVPLKGRVLEAVLKSFGENLPLGYRVERGDIGKGQILKQAEPYLYIFLVFLLMYLLAAAMLEDLRLSLWAVSVIPMSFVGLFLTFYLGKFPFDQGGYAAMLLLSGIGINAAFFLIYEYRNQLRVCPNNPRLYAFHKAFSLRIKPILFTLFSTMLGFLPFLWEEATPFWYSLAVGSVGGLFSSLLGLVLILPLFLIRGRG